MNNVLMVDDSKTAVLAVSRYLAPYGFKVSAADNFVEIPRVVSQTRPIAIILDLNMPALSGLQIGRFLNRMGFNGRIIVYSGESEAKLSGAAKEIGAHSHVAKESNLEPLLKALQACIVTDSVPLAPVREANPALATTR